MIAKYGQRSQSYPKLQVGSDYPIAGSYRQLYEHNITDNTSNISIHRLQVIFAGQWSKVAHESMAISAMLINHSGRGHMSIKGQIKTQTKVKSSNEQRSNQVISEGQIKLRQSSDQVTGKVRSCDSKVQIK